MDAIHSFKIIGTLQTLQNMVPVFLKTIKNLRLYLQLMFKIVYDAKFINHCIKNGIKLLVKSERAKTVLLMIVSSFSIDGKLQSHRHPTVSFLHHR